MNAAIQHNLNEHYWKLLVSLGGLTKNQLQHESDYDRSRTLILHLRHKECFFSAIEQAITSNYYEEISLPSDGLSAKDRGILQLKAIRHSTRLHWTDKKKSLNSASQLSLI